MLVTYVFPGDYTVIASAGKIWRLKEDFRKLGLNEPGQTYEYEEADGSKVIGTYIGFSGLNLKFCKADETTFAAPVTDMGDGSLVTEYLTKLSR